MTTWVQPIHHPWFDRSPLKRKLSNADDERRPSPYQRSSPSPTSRAKRRKFNTLEHGFAHLSLASASVHPHPAGGLLITPIAHPSVSSEYSSFPPASVVLPSSVEEPPHELETSAHEVSMEYGDEREYLSDTPMVSADFDMPTACADSDKLKSHEEAPISPRFSISTPFLQRLRKHQTAPQPIIPISSASVDIGALVLYRPLRPPSPSPKVDEYAEVIEEIVAPEAVALLQVSEPASIDDDAMDIE
ncbi:hypothetical protein K503DRAFT_778758 [Rhizopogon vinicolor AM-OR11-026]|uniref:Uncharacterized protein n=1 Tax=Rhizopogon vinicolor AM-OR11-026 TaxID=1314800 RepID=A0A1B7NH05_9AGAM|nr:hypothetical protein K503DRAFT_778758 [Rhizopogon vinicolor AM-OR11-026]